MEALVVTTDGFRDSEFSYPYYRPQEADVDVVVATHDGESLTGKHDYEFEADDPSATSGGRRPPVDLRAGIGR